MEKEPIHAMKTRGLIPIAIGLTFGRCRFFSAIIGYYASRGTWDLRRQHYVLTCSSVRACVRAGGAFSDKLAVELSSCFFRDLFSPCGL